MSESGIGKILINQFEKSSEIKTKVTVFPDSFRMVNQLELDHRLQRKTADIVIGFDQNTWSRVKPYANQLSDWRPTAWKRIHEFTIFEPGFLPFDYGELGFIADLEALKSAKIDIPKKLDDLLLDIWKKKFIIEDPRSSSPGLFFLTWTHKVKADDSTHFWKQIRRQWLTLSPGWSEAYSLFLDKKAPLVWSYKTSLAYHRSEKKGDRYAFISLNEGAPLQVEGAAILTTSSEKLQAAHKLMNLLLSKEIQKQILTTQWMLPVRKDLQLPLDFKDMLPTTAIASAPLTSSDLEDILNSWKKAIRQ